MNHWVTTPELWKRLKPVAQQMRRDPTPAEQHLWQYLRGRRLLDCKFRRQHPFERFILDFYCHEAKLVIEVDGPVHQYSADEDAIRQEFIEQQGLTVLRFSNDEVLGNTVEVLQQILCYLHSVKNQTQ